MPYVHVNNIDLYYVDSGAGDPLIFVHGWGTSGRVWDQQARYFRDRNRVLQLDWRGNGRSEATSEGNTILQVASDIGQFIEKLNLNRVTLVGTSMGSSFVLETARQWPERLKMVVTVNGIYHLGALHTEGNNKIQSMLDALEIERIPTLMAMASSWYEGEEAEAYTFWARSQLIESSPHIVELYADHRGYDPRAFVKEIEVPIILIHGAKDATVPVDIPMEISEILNGAPLHIIEEAGHFPHHTSPVQFNRILATVLDS